MQQTAIIFNQSDIETAQPQIVADIISQANRGSSTLSTLRRALAQRITLPRIYRLELRMARAIARWIDRHPRLSNAILYTEAAVGMYLIFMYA